VVRHTFVNKGKTVHPSSEYKNQKHLSDSKISKITHSKITIYDQNNNKLKTIKRGALIGLKLINQDDVQYLYKVEGFNSNQILASKFVLDTTETKELLSFEYSSFYNFDSIEYLMFSTNHIRRTKFAVLVSKITGWDLLFFIPFGLTMSLLTSGELPDQGYVEAGIMTAAGIPLLIIDKKLREKLKFTKYSLENFKLKQQ